MANYKKIDADTLEVPSLITRKQLEGQRELYRRKKANVEAKLIQIEDMLKELDK